VYCRNCGKSVDTQAVFCPNCSAQPANGRKFCQNCGQTTDPAAEFCEQCGARLATGNTGNAGDKAKVANINFAPNLKTLILVGWIFTLLALVAEGFYLLIAIIFGTILGGIGSAISPGTGAFVFGTFILEVIILAVFAIPSFLVFIRFGKMRKAIDAGDIKTLKSLNSTGWAVVALIFAGVIPGVMLLMVHSSIEELT